MTVSNEFPFQFLHAQQVQAENRAPAIRRRNYEVCTVEYVTKGYGYLRTNGQYFEIGPDSVYFLHKGSTHEYRQDKNDPWHKLFWVADGPLMEELFQIYGIGNVHYIPNARELKSYFEAFLKLSRAMPRFNERAAVIFHGFAEACGAHLAKPEKHVPGSVLKLKQAMDGSLDHAFKLADYCREAGLSTAYAVRAFHQAFGCSPVEYLLDRRLEAAQRLLRYSQLSVKEIAASLSFCDQYHFSTFYKKRTGESPSVFRDKRGE